LKTSRPCLATYRAGVFLFKRDTSRPEPNLRLRTQFGQRQNFSLTGARFYIIRNYYEELQQRIGLAPPDPLGFLVHHFQFSWRCQFPDLDGGAALKEHVKASDWRIRHELSQKELGERIGYNRTTISWFEIGRNAPTPNRKGTRIKAEVWQRYKRACGDLDAELNGRKAGERFDW